MSARLGHNRPSQGGNTRAAPQDAPPGAHGVVLWPGGQGWGTHGRGGSTENTPSTGGPSLCPPESPPPGGAALALPLALDHARSPSPRGMRRAWGDLGCQKTAGTRQAVQPLPGAAAVPQSQPGSRIGPLASAGEGALPTDGAASPRARAAPWTHGRKPVAPGGLDPGASKCGSRFRSPPHPKPGQKRRLRPSWNAGPRSGAAQLSAPAHPRDVPRSAEQGRLRDLAHADPPAFLLHAELKPAAHFTDEETEALAIQSVTCPRPQL